MGVDGRARTDIAAMDVREQVAEVVGLSDLQREAWSHRAAGWDDHLHRAVEHRTERP